jgi:class 3 adenylate cyclase
MTDLNAAHTRPKFVVESPNRTSLSTACTRWLRGQRWPLRAQGTVLLADVSGFTSLTARLARELGPQRGSEEITRLLSCVFDAVTDEVHRCGGSVISFSSDAITFWFDDEAINLALGQET